MALLELSHVTYSYSQLEKKQEGDTTPVLRDVSLSLEEGECVALLGSSGAGKSTIGNMVLGLLAPHAGTVRINGIDLYGGDKRSIKKLRSQVQAVFQDCYSSVNSKMTAGQIIGEPMDNFQRMSRKEKQARIEELLEVVGLSASDIDKFPRQFSGGQLQRICIARAIAVKPRLIVLDESVSSLDVVNQVNIIRLLRLLKEQFGMSYLFITHNLKAAFALGDRFIVLDKGEIRGCYSDRTKLQQSDEPAAKRLMKSSLAGRPELGFIRSDRRVTAGRQREEGAGL